MPQDLRTNLLLTIRALGRRGPARRAALRRICLTSAGLATAFAGMAMIAQVPGPHAEAAVVVSPAALQTPARTAPEAAPLEDNVLNAALLASDNRPAAHETKVETLPTPAPAPELLREVKGEQLTIPAPKPVTAQKQRTMWMMVTAYCACPKCCGSDASGITASGKKVTYNRGRFVAADTSVLPFGTKLSIPGYHNGLQVEVIDRGSAIKGRKLDVYFADHDTATEWGRRWIPITVYEKSK